MLKKTYTVACAANIECNSSAGLICPSVSSNCNCPTTSAAYKCDCNSSRVKLLIPSLEVFINGQLFISLAAYYWDGANCGKLSHLLKKSFPLSLDQFE